MLIIRKIMAIMVFAAASLGAAMAFAQDGAKSTIGIGGIRSSIREADPYSFQNMLETQLIKTNKFKIIERSRLEEILREKGLGAAGIVDGGDPKISGVTGVDYLVYGSITKLGATGQGFRLGDINVANSKVEMAVDLRVVNAHTGEIMYADTVQEAVAGADSSSFGGLQVGNRSGDPRADVERATARSITALVVTSIYPIRVIAVQGDGLVVLNYGDSVLAPGDQLKVFQVGESFKDPDTGEVLGSEEKQVALLKIAEATDRFSKASLVEGNAVVGNTARRLSAAEASRTGSKKRNGKELPRR